MAVIIRPRFNTAQIQKVLEQKRQAILNTIAQGLQQIGEQFVANARNQNTYKDKTGNLRSSIGYVLYHNGTLVSSGFPGSTAEGTSKARQLADDVAKDHSKGFVLICVAGMEYAAAVEAKGFDVITKSSVTALADVRKMVARLKQKVSKL